MKRSDARGFTLIEIMIVVAIIALLAAVAIPGLLRGRTSANEAAAISNTRTLISGNEMYRSVNNVYSTGGAAWVTQMYPTGEPAFGPAPFNHVMDGTAASLTQGYLWVYANPTTTTYTLTAFPQTPQTTGTRSFFADESGQIRHCTCGAGAGQCTLAGPNATLASKTIDLPPNASCP